MEFEARKEFSKSPPQNRSQILEEKGESEDKSGSRTFYNAHQSTKASVPTSLTMGSD